MECGDLEEDPASSGMQDMPQTAEHYTSIPRNGNNGPRGAGLGEIC